MLNSLKMEDVIIYKYVLYEFIVPSSYPNLISIIHTPNFQINFIKIL